MRLNTNTFNDFAIILGIMFAYFAAAKLGLLLAYEQVNTSPVWPPTGVAIAALWCLGQKYWPGVLLGSFWVTYTISSGNLVVVTCMALGNVFEAVVAVQVLRKLRLGPVLKRPRESVIFILTLFFSTMISATFGVGSLMWQGVIQSGQFPVLWITWWLGNLVGGLVVTPLLITWRHWPDKVMQKKRFFELMAITFVSLETMYLVFFYSSSEFSHIHLLTYLLLPILVWSALRFHYHGATAMVFVFATLAIVGTELGHGPFVRPSAHDALLALQASVGAVMVMLLILLAIQEERLEVVRTSRLIRQELQDRVEVQTHELRASNEQLTIKNQRQLELTQAMQSLMNTIDRGGESFFSDCVQGIAKTFNTRFAFIGVLDEDQPSRINTLAVWAHDGVAKNFSYDLDGTPCEDVLNHSLEFIPTEAATQYPQDQLLIDMGIDSYFGAPLISDDGEVIGIIAVMDTVAMPDRPWLRPILRLFSNRVLLEIQRKNALLELTLADNVFEESLFAILVCDANKKVIRLNPQFTKLTGYSEEDVVGQTPSIWKSGLNDPELYQELWSAIEEKGVWQGELINKRKDEQLFVTSQMIKAVYAEDGSVVQYFSMFHDISDKKKIEQQLYQLAHSDLITQLPNRLSFHKMLESALERAKLDETRLAVMFIDLDHFKLINDTSGHPVGDELLAQVAVRLQKSIGSANTISRFGGDEFTVLMPCIESVYEVSEAAQGMLEALSKPFQLSSCELTISASIGIGLFPDNGLTVSSLLSRADNAMYCAKESGRSGFQFYTEQMDLDSLERVRLEQDLRTALKQEEFLLYFQPQVELQTGRLCGVETLVRWQHPTRGMVPPDVFIPVAEATGLIVPLGEWIIEQALCYLKLLQDSVCNDFTLSINLSPRQFFQKELPVFIQQALEQFEINPSNVMFEITESMMMEDVDATVKTLNKLKSMGVLLSLDDFGTGYSSLSYLKRFPIDELKIDRAFIQGLPNDTDDIAIVSAIIAVAHALGIKLIAEGLESDAQLALLKSLNCEFAQGYYFAKPMPYEALLIFVNSNSEERFLSLAH